jgi:ABC-type transport system involved in multi-copper enzyme maturation permease subunit
MPIHDQGYRRYEGRRDRHGHAWSVVAAAGLRTFFTRRIFLGLLLLSWLPTIVRAVQFYAAANLPQVPILAPTAATFRQFLDQQSNFVFFMTVYVGAGLIANDRRANALQIYLSRPMTRADYVLGKLAILAASILMVTWAPAMVLLLLQAAFAGSFAFLRANLYLVPAITVFSALQTVSVSMAMLALSSLSKSSRYVALLYAALVFFSVAVFGVLRFVTRGTSLAWISLPNDLAQVGDAIFRVPLRFETPWPAAFAAIVALVVLSGAILARRVRGVETVA